MGAKLAFPDARQLKAIRNLLREEAALLIAKAQLDILRSKRLIFASVRARRHPRRKQ